MTDPLPPPSAVYLPFWCLDCASTDDRNSGEGVDVTAYLDDLLYCQLYDYVYFNHFGDSRAQKLKQKVIIGLFKSKQR